MLLTKCQQEFEKDKKDDEDRDQMLKAIEEAETVGNGMWGVCIICATARPVVIREVWLTSSCVCMC